MFVMKKKIKDVLIAPNILCGYLYAYVHFILEVVCFCYLSRVSNSLIVWLVPFLYDGFAFIPQSLIGYIKDKYPKFNEGLLGACLLFIGILLFSFCTVNKFIILFLVSIGNALLHVEGAYNTLMSSNGKLSHPAIFVGFGAFGVITGRIIGKTSMPTWFLLPLIVTMIPILLFGNQFVNKESSCKKFNYVKNNKNTFMVILLATFVVVVRGYMGYRIPSAWQTTTIHTVLLFVTMGLGKILGGILADIIGLKKVASISTLLALPFIILGNNNMFISLFGIMCFSMTMSITLAIMVSVLKKNPGLAFGFTTIGLSLGTFPIFFITISNTTLNTILLVTLSLISYFILNYILKGNKNGSNI